MNQDLINKATAELAQHFQNYLEEKNRLYEFREFREHSLRIPLAIKTYLPASFTKQFSEEEIKIICNVDLFGVIHVDGTKDVYAEILKVGISKRRATNKIFADMLAGYKQSEGNNLWFINQIAKFRTIYKQNLTEPNNITPEGRELVTHAQNILKNFNILDPEEAFSNLIIELDMFSKYLIYEYDLFEWEVKIQKALEVLQKLIDLDLIDDYKNIWIFIRAKSENQKLGEEFNDEIFLTSKIPLNPNEANQIINSLSKIGILFTNNKVQVKSELKQEFQDNFLQIVNTFNSNINAAREFLNMFNLTDLQTIESLGNLFELLRFTNTKKDCYFTIDNRLIYVEQERLASIIDTSKLQFIFSPELIKNKDKYLDIINALNNLKGNDSEINNIISRCVVSINQLVQESIEVFDIVHTEGKIDSLFSFFYNFDHFQIYNLVFYNDLSEIFNIFDANGIETVSLRLENFFYNYFSILNIAISDTERYHSITREHNNRLIKYINKESALIKNNGDHMGIIRTILSWAEEDNQLVEVPTELLEGVLIAEKPDPGLVNILSDTHKILLKAYSQMFFEFFKKGLKTANIDEVTKYYKGTIIEQFTEYNQMLAYFYIIGFYFEVEQNMNFQSKLSLESLDQYIRGY